MLPGKVELGQGITTAVAQIAAEELDVDLSRVRMVRARTGSSPDEAVTSGSQSVQECGTALRYAGAEARALLVGAAAARWGCRSRRRCTVSDGVISDAASGRKLAYWELDSAALLDREASGQVAPKAAAPHRLVGTAGASASIFPTRCSAAALSCTTWSCPACATAACCAPPRPARACKAWTMPPPAPCPASPSCATAALSAWWRSVKRLPSKPRPCCAKGAVWSAGPGLPPAEGLHDWLRAQPVETKVIDRKDAPAAAAPVVREVSARYAKPYLAHASIGPSCAIAQWQRRANWRSGATRRASTTCAPTSALTFGIDKADITIEHVEGAGCYGHNGADDVALDAALLARALPGRAGTGGVVARGRAGLVAARPGDADIEIKAGLDAGRATSSPGTTRSGATATASAPAAPKSRPCWPRAISKNRSSNSSR